MNDEVKASCCPGVRACTAGSSGIRDCEGINVALPLPPRLRLPRHASTTSDAYFVTDFVTDSPTTLQPVPVPPVPPVPPAPPQSATVFAPGQNAWKTGYNYTTTVMFHPMNAEEATLAQQTEELGRKLGESKGSKDRSKIKTSYPRSWKSSSTSARNDIWTRSRSPRERSRTQGPG